MTFIPIVPAVIPTSREEVIEQARRLAFSREFHLDLVDGKFVKTVSWPYQPVGDPLSVKSALDVFTLEVDLMVNEPLAAAISWEKAGADMLVFHVETLSLEQFKNFTDTTKVSVGVSASGSTSLETLLEYLPYADYAQLMGIYEIGAQGQPFDEVVFEKIKKLKEHFPELSITVDGSVNEKTIRGLYEAGADRFICGSAIVGQADPEAAWLHLRGLINE